MTRPGQINRRALARIEALADRRAKRIAEFIVNEIATNPDTPQDDDPGREAHEHLRFSYYAVRDKSGGGDWLIKSRSKYWVYVEFGTAQHGHAQPHVRPAIDLARERFR